MTKKQIIRFIDEQMELVATHEEAFAHISADKDYEDFTEMKVVDDNYLKACEGLAEFTTVSDLIEAYEEWHAEVYKWQDNLDQHLKMVEEMNLRITDKYFDSRMRWKLDSFRETVYTFCKQANEIEMYYALWKAAHVI